MYYIESTDTDPSFNLALEQYVFDRMPQDYGYFMLWQNDHAIIVGKHQNTAQEINADYVNRSGIRVIRRLSGGGAVYHDLGNLNYTFIVDAGAGGLEFSAFCQPVIAALAELGVTAELSGRNDMTIGGQKFSGNAQYRKRGRVMHHGTILYDSNLSILGDALNVPADKISSKGLKSVQSRVTNIRPHMPQNLPFTDFFTALKKYWFHSLGLTPLTLSDCQIAEIKQLQADRYATWEWNFGASPPYQLQKKRRIDGCGSVEIYLSIAAGRIEDLRFYGDFFSHKEPEELAALLRGCALEEQALCRALENTDVGSFIHGMTLPALLNLLLT